MNNTHPQGAAERPLPDVSLIRIAAIALCIAAMPLVAQDPPPFVQNAPAPVAQPAPAPSAPVGAPPAAVAVSASPVTASIALSSGAATDPTAHFDVAADHQDAAGVLNRLAQQAGASLVFVGNLSGATTTVALRGVTFDQAVDLIAKSAGLAATKSGSGWIVGTPADVATSLAPPPPIPGQSTQAIYRCEHISASTLVTTLQSTFDPNVLKVVLGPTYLSPTLSSGGSTVAVTGDQGSTVSTLGDSDATLRTQEVIFVGDAATVQRAMDLAQQLDHHRAQVRIRMSISDVSVDALKKLGLQWEFSDYGVSENPNTTQPTASGSIPVVSGIKFGSFAHLPVAVTATISALETNGEAKLLAQPTLALLDGERSFILIGQRELFPKLVTSYYGAPTYDVQEVRVGIYIQVAAQIGRDNDVVLSIYPQVSLISDHLSVNGAVYPIIDTREQQTTIRAKSGQTIVIGGLIRDDDLKSIERIPLLGRIPVIGELFKYRESAKTRTELIVTLTPEIERED